MQFNTHTIWETQCPRSEACEFTARILRRLKLIERVDPVEWIEANISLSHDPTSAATGNIQLDPWQIEPIRAQFDPATRMVVIMAVEQIGKSTLWRMPMAYKMLFDPAPRWIIYESDTKAEDINRDTFHPVLTSIPDVADMLNRLSANKRRYTLVNGSITDFSGAGADITSKPKRDGVADEVDRWGTFDFAQQNLRNFVKRFRTFWRRNLGCLTVCSSPKTEGGKQSVIGNLFEETDQCYWHLRCEKCGELSMRSCDIHNLQWELDASENVVESSLRLVCPKCKHPHLESSAETLTCSGDYVARAPGQSRKRGFQIGALGVPRVFSWLDIAEAQIKSGSTASPIERADFYNSWRGLPMKASAVDGDLVSKLRRRIVPIPAATEIAFVLMACDTQDDCVYYVIRAFDHLDNSYLVHSGKAITWDDLDAAWSREYLGRRPLAGIIDAGGHGTRPTEVAAFVRSHQGFFSYKGNPRIGCRLKPATEAPGMIIANTDIFKPELLYRMYQAPPSPRGNWFIGSNPDETYLKQVADMRPDPKVRNGNDFNNWKSTGNDHLFDCEKEVYILHEVIAQVKRKSSRARPAATVQKF